MTGETTRTPQTFEEREVRIDVRFARFWGPRIREQDHPLAILIREHSDLAAVVEQIARNAFRSGVHLGEKFGDAALASQQAQLRAAREVVEAVGEWEAAERSVAVDSLPYLGLGPDEVFDRRDKAIAELRAALAKYRLTTSEDK